MKIQVMCKLVPPLWIRQGWEKSEVVLNLSRVEIEVIRDTLGDLGIGLRRVGLARGGSSSTVEQLNGHVKWEQLVWCNHSSPEQW